MTTPTHFSFEPPAATPCRFGRAPRVRVCALLLLACLAVSCGKSGAGTVEKAEPDATSNLFYFFQLERTNPAVLKAKADQWHSLEELLLLNARRTIPCLREFTGLFTNSVEFRHYARDPADPNLWTLQTGLYGRHLLRMEVQFKVDATRTNITSYDPPRLSLTTYDDGAPSRNGMHVFSERNLAASDWTRLLSSGGDLSAIGFQGWTNRPIKGFDWAWRNNIR